MSHSLQNKQDKLTAGTGISITDNTIACTVKAPSYLLTSNGAIGSYALVAMKSSSTVGKGSSYAWGGKTSGTVYAWAVMASYTSSTITDISLTWNGVVSAVPQMTGTWKCLSNVTTKNTGAGTYSLYVGTVAQRIA